MTASAPTSTPVLRCLDVGFQRGSRRLFDRLSLDLGDREHGSVTAVVGISGIGKSTFLRMIAGLERPRTGRIEISVSPQAVSFLSQQPVIFDHLSALENAHYLLRVRRLPVGKAFERLVSALGLEGILANRTPVTALSGGERQRLAILRALSIEPSLVLLDEPCAGLDPTLRAGVIDGLQRAISESSATVIYVTHHLDEIALSSDRVLFFENPRDPVGPVQVMGSATAEFLARPPTLDAAKFALFPRCNVLHGRVSGGRFVTTTCVPVDGESLAFLPTQIELVDSVPSTGDLVLRHRGSYVWTEVQGESLAIYSPKAHDINTVHSTLCISPGALVYTSANSFKRILSERLLLQHDGRI